MVTNISSVLGWFFVVKPRTAARRATRFEIQLLKATCFVLGWLLKYIAPAADCFASMIEARPMPKPSFRGEITPPPENRFVRIWGTARLLMFVVVVFYGIGFAQIAIFGAH